MGKFKIPSIMDVEQEIQDKNKDLVGESKLRVGAGLLSDASKQTVLKTVNIPRDQIVKNPNNIYSIKGIDSLAESIKQYTLVEPLHVAPAENGVYKLLGGERRLTAIDKLIADKNVPEWNEDTLIPCVVKGYEDVKLDLSDENKERYAIITTNKESRVYTDADAFFELQEWKKIIQELRDKGIEYMDHYDEEGNDAPISIKGEKTRDILAKATGMSTGQVNKFEVVNNRGSEQLKDALLSGKVSVSVAEKAAKELTEEEQNKLIEEAGDKKITTADIAEATGESTVITSEMFRKDIKNINAMLKDGEVELDEKEAKKYYYYVGQIEKLFRCHK